MTGRTHAGFDRLNRRGSESPLVFKTEALHFISRACPPVSSRGDSKEKAIMGAAAPKPPLAIPPHSKLRGFLAFSREISIVGWENTSIGALGAHIR